MKLLQNPDLTATELRDLAEQAETAEEFKALIDHRSCPADLKENLYSRLLDDQITLDLSAENRLINPRSFSNGEAVEDVDYDPVDGFWDEIRALRELGVESFSLQGKRVKYNLYEISLGEEPLETPSFTLKRSGSWAMKPAMVASIVASLSFPAMGKELTRMEQLQQELNQAGFSTELKNKPTDTKKEEPKTRMEQQAEELRQAGFDVKLKK